MRHNPYFILVLAVGLLYYLIFKYRDERLWQMIGIVGILGGLIASIATILAIAIIPVGMAIFVLFSLLTVKAWQVRNDPKMKMAAYIWFGTIVFCTLVLIIGYFLIQLGK